jgi:hypothetical protein
MRLLIIGAWGLTIHRYKERTGHNVGHVPVPAAALCVIDWHPLRPFTALAKVAGLGTINLTPLRLQRGITISITLEPPENGRTRADSWTSHDGQYPAAMMNLAGVAAT